MKTRKSKWFMAGMAALLPTFGLVLAGCEDEPDEGGGGTDVRFTICSFYCS
jgi:hypothetical protein